MKSLFTQIMEKRTKKDFEKKIKTLEKIKDKLIVILNQCKCLSRNHVIRKEALSLVQNYHKLNNSNKNNTQITCQSIEQKINKKRKKSLVVVDEDEDQEKKSRKVRVWDNEKCPCSWPGCEKTFPTNNKLVFILIYI